jgi:hypothetical protein
VLRVRALPMNFFASDEMATSLRRGYNSSTKRVLNAVGQGI